jgi:hypothetical protein
MLSRAHKLDELNLIVDQHLHCEITEDCLPTYQGTMRLQKLALLWMLEEKIGKGKSSEKEKEKSENKGEPPRSRS